METEKQIQEAYLRLLRDSLIRYVHAQIGLDTVQLGTLFNVDKSTVSRALAREEIDTRTMRKLHKFFNK